MTLHYVIYIQYDGACELVPPPPTSVTRVIGWCLHWPRHMNRIIICKLNSGEGSRNYHYVPQWRGIQGTCYAVCLHTPGMELWLCVIAMCRWEVKLVITMLTTCADGVILYNSHLLLQLVQMRGGNHGYNIHELYIVHYYGNQAWQAWNGQRWYRPW